MLSRFAPRLLPLICLCALVCSVAASTAGAVTVGISDNGS